MPSNARMIVGLLLLFCLAGGSALAGEKPVVYFGVNLRYDPIKMYERYQPVMDYLTQSTPYTFKMRISHDYQEGVKDLEQGRVEIASLGDGAVVGALLRHGAIPIVKPLNANRKALYQCYFIVSEKSGIRTLRDLKGKKVALGYHHSLTGNLLARQMLRKSGIKESDLAALDNLKNHTAVTKAVIKGEYDAGAVKDVVGRIYLKHGLRIIAASDECPSVPLVARKGTSPKLIKAVTDALVQLDRMDPSHRKILKSWDDEYEYGFVRTSVDDYRDMMRLYQSFPYGCGVRCHR